MNITPHLFEAFLKCPTKCHVRSLGETGPGNAYAEWVRAQDESYQREAARRLQEGVLETERVVALTATEDLKTAQWLLAVNVVVQTPDRSADSHVRASQPGEATRGLGGPRSEHVLESRLHAVSLGKIIHGDDHATLKVRLGARTAESARTHAKTKGLAAEVRKRIEKMIEMLSSSPPTWSADSHVRESLPNEETRGLSGPRSVPAPDLVLNRHCAECEFQARCRKIAVEKDDLSLLANLSAKERQELRSQGIFTVTQLSYTFRPRRRPKRQRDKKEKYHHSLKALAIREQKIHIVGSPELKIEGTPVYLDVEGLPDRDFYYLIGVRIGHGDSAVQHSLWADTIADEGKIWREFLALLETVEQPVLIHYGSYETTFLKAMKERHGGPLDDSVVAKAIATARNLVSVMFAQIYFPTFSNGLKDMAGWLGYKWSAINAGGTQAIIWRHQWEESCNANGKTELVRYNTQDCEALGSVTGIVQRLNQTHTCQGGESNQQLAAVAADSLMDQSTLFRRFVSPIAELELINKAARWNYQRDRIYLRTSDQIRRATRQQKRMTHTLKPNKVILAENPSLCPKCGRAMKHWPMERSILYDVHFNSGGLKRRVIHYNYRRTRCDFCHLNFGRPEPFRPHSKYGRNLLALIAFQVAGLCMPQRTVCESLNSLLGFTLSLGARTAESASPGRSGRHGMAVHLSKILGAPTSRHWNVRTRQSALLWRCAWLGRRLEPGVFVAETRAAEGPLRRGFHQTRLHRIRFDVVNHFAVMRFIPNVAIPIIVLPQLAMPPQDAIDAARGVALPTQQKFAHRFLPDFHEHVDVVGHHDPRQHAVILAVTVKPVLLDDACDFRFAQFAVAEAAIHVFLNLRVTLQLVFEVEQRGPFMPAAGGHGVVESVVEHLDDTRNVEVRQVAARMPAAKAELGGFGIGRSVPLALVADGRGDVAMALAHRSADRRVRANREAKHGGIDKHRHP